MEDPKRKAGRPRTAVTILRELRDQYIAKRDKIFNRYAVGDIRQDSFHHKCELIKVNGHIEAILEAIDRIK